MLCWCTCLLGALRRACPSGLFEAQSKWMLLSGLGTPWEMLEQILTDHELARCMLMPSAHCAWHLLGAHESFGAGSLPRMHIYRAMVAKRLLHIDFLGAGTLCAGGEAHHPQGAHAFCGCRVQQVV